MEGVVSNVDFDGKYPPTGSLQVVIQMQSSSIPHFSLAKDNENSFLECTQDIEKLSESENI